MGILPRARFHRIGHYSLDQPLVIQKCYNTYDLKGISAFSPGIQVLSTAISIICVSEAHNQRRPRFFRGKRSRARSKSAEKSECAERKRKRANSPFFFSFCRTTLEIRFQSPNPMVLNKVFAYPCCISLLHVLASHPCFMSTRHVHATCSYCMSILFCRLRLNCFVDFDPIRGNWFLGNRPSDTLC